MICFPFPHCLSFFCHLHDLICRYCCSCCRLCFCLTCVCLFAGTASRLCRKSSYHHCTLLHSADRSALTDVLRPSCRGIQSNATPSVPSPVANLLDHAPTLQWEELLDALANQYNTGLQIPTRSSQYNLVTEAICWTQTVTTAN